MVRWICWNSIASVAMLFIVVDDRSWDVMSIWLCDCIFHSPELLWLYLSRSCILLSILTVVSYKFIFCKKKRRWWNNNWCWEFVARILDSSTDKFLVVIHAINCSLSVTYYWSLCYPLLFNVTYNLLKLISIAES